MPAVISWRQGSFDLLRQIDWRRFSCAIVEAPGWIRFLENGIGDAICPDACEGLAFGTDAELRWRRLDNGQYHLVIIDDAGTAPQGWTSQDLVAVPEGEPERILLWNARDTRIPWPASSPAPRGGVPLAVSLRHYLLETKVPEPSKKRAKFNSAPVRLFRCCAIEGE